MPAQVTTRAQVNGYRFLIRRLEHALIRGDSRMIHDPMRGQMRSLIVGVIIAILITGACAVMAFFKPTPNLGDAQILLSKSSGAAFVRIGDKVHPVLNLASARLIVGKNDSPKEVDDKFLNPLPRGPMVGIIGAPSSIRGGDNMAMSSWTVCDSLQTPGVTETTGAARLQTTVLANDPVLDSGAREAGPADAILTEVSGISYLIYDGVRAPIDMSDPVLVNGLHLQDAQTQAGFAGPAQYVPAGRSDHAGDHRRCGGAQPSAGAGLPGRIDGQDGRLPGRTALRRAARGSATRLVGHRRHHPARRAGRGCGGPGHRPGQAGRGADRASAAGGSLSVGVAADRLRRTRTGWCAWRGSASNTAAEADVRMLVGHRLPVPEGAQPVGLATADGNGPGVDSVYLTPGAGEYVQATGGEPDSQSMGELFYVSDTGLRYHIKDLPTADALGVTGVKVPDGPQNAPQKAPWPVVSLLPPGPALSQEAALVAHDGMAADPDSVTVQVPD